MNGNLIYKRNALLKRRSELLEQLCDCADSIAEIDAELQEENMSKPSSSEDLMSLR